MASPDSPESECRKEVGRELWLVGSLHFLLECAHKQWCFVCVSVAKLRLHFPEFPSRSELGSARGEIAGD